MGKHLLDVNDDRQFWQFAFEGHALQQFIVSHQLDFAVDPEGIIHAGNHEDQAYLRVLNHVSERIQPIIARQIGNGNRLIIQHPNKTGVISLRGNVATTFGVGGAEQNKWAFFDDGAAMNIQPIDLLFSCTL